MKIESAIKEIGHVIDLWIPWKIRYDFIPGVSIGIVYKGRLIYSGSFGFADVSRRTKMKPDTLFHIASHSKMFTAVSILQLVEKGKLRLDDRVSSYISWFKGRSKHSDAANITIRQLLSHTAGVFRDGDTPFWETGDFPKDLKEVFSMKSLAIENSMRFKYTNFGFALLGLVIEKASGMSYAEYIAKNILKPLGMKHTYPDYSKGMNGIATGYGHEVPDQKRIAFKHFSANAYASATGFISNVPDMARFISALSLDSKSGILSRESKKEMMRAHARTNGNDEYGLGLDIYYEGNRKIIGHGGGYHGFTTGTFLDVQNDVAFMVYTNSAGSRPSVIGSSIMEAAVNLAREGDLHSGKKALLRRYEGLYRNSWGDEVVAASGRALIGFSPDSSDPWNKPRRFVPTSKRDAFLMKSDNVYGSFDEEAVFRKFRSGKATELLQADMPLKRVQQ
ncbi:beta-lactamase family protein [Patescibacteria group bacterium]|nr:beta-lactamase family protein [Patescibacteria group bacterium]